MGDGPPAERRGSSGSRRLAAVWGALAFGVIAGSLVAGGVVMRLPGALVVTDPREVVVSLGGALCGPLAGAFIGFCAGIFERIPNVALPSAIGHAAAGLWMGWAYRRIARSELCRAKPIALGLAWAGALVVYYAGVLYPMGLLASVVLPWLGLQPSIWTDPAHAAVGPVKALPLVLRDAGYEFCATLALTSAVWLVLPRAHRRPLLDAESEPTATSDPPPAPPRDRPAPARDRPGLARWLVGLLFGACSGLVILSGLHLVLPGTQLVLDPREALVTLGAALCGPGPAVLIGVLAAAVEPIAGTHAISLANHVIGGLVVALLYRRLAVRHAESKRLTPILAGWVGVLTIYYFVILVPITCLGFRVSPSLTQEVFGQSRVDWPLVGLMARAAVWEWLVTCAITTAALCALPRRARLPLSG